MNTAIEARAVKISRAIRKEIRTLREGGHDKAAGALYEYMLEADDESLLRFAEIVNSAEAATPVTINA